MRMIFRNLVESMNLIKASSSLELRNIKGQWKHDATLDAHEAESSLVSSITENLFIPNKF